MQKGCSVARPPSLLPLTSKDSLGRRYWLPLAYHLLCCRLRRHLLLLLPRRSGGKDVSNMHRHLLQRPLRKALHQPQLLQLPRRRKVHGDALPAARRRTAAKHRGDPPQVYILRGIGRDQLEVKRMEARHSEKNSGRVCEAWGWGQSSEGEVGACELRAGRDEVYGGMGSCSDPW
jgi:hypothetical protein